MPLHLAAWKEASRQFGFHFDASWLHSLGGVPSRKIAALIAEQQGISLEPVKVAEVKAQHYTRMLEQARPFPAMLQLLKRWQGRLPMAIGTGSARVAAEAVLRTTVITSYSINSTKLYDTNT